MWAEFLLFVNAHKCITFMFQITIQLMFICVVAGVSTVVAVMLTIYWLLWKSRKKNIVNYWRGLYNNVQHGWAPNHPSPVTFTHCFLMNFFPQRHTNDSNARKHPLLWERFGKSQRHRLIKEENILSLISPQRTTTGLKFRIHRSVKWAEKLEKALLDVFLSPAYLIFPESSTAKL